MFKIEWKKNKFQANTIQIENGIKNKRKTHLIEIHFGIKLLIDGYRRRQRSRRRRFFFLQTISVMCKQQLS